MSPNDQLTNWLQVAIGGAAAFIAVLAVVVQICKYMKRIQKTAPSEKVL